MSLNDSEEIKPEQLPQEIRALKPASGLEPLMQKQQKSFMTLDELESKYIKEVLTHTQGNKTKAAQILGIHSTSLFRKLKKRK
jgi:DNA-binding NtrC family response regulator